MKYTILNLSGLKYGGQDPWLRPGQTKFITQSIMLTTHPRQGKFLRVRNDFLLIWIDFKDMDRILNIRRSRLLYVPAPPTNAYLRSCFQTQIPFKHTPHVSLYVKTSSRRT